MPVEVSFAILADSANVSQEGKLNLLGAFSLIFAPRFPAIHPSCILAFQFRAEHQDQQREHEVTVSFIDEDSRELFSIAGKLTVGRIKPGQFREVPHLVRINGLRLPAEGRYRFRIQVGDVQHDVVLAAVVPIPK